MTLMLRHDFVWVYSIIGCCVCDINTIYKDTHLTRAPEAKYYCIPTEVRTNLDFICI